MKPQPPAVPQTVAGPSATPSNTDKAKSTDVFHEKHPEDQEVITRINSNIRRLIRSKASQRAWVTRKRMRAARTAAAREAEKAEREGKRE